MKKNNSLRPTVLSLAPLLCAISLASTPALAQQASNRFSAPHFQSIVLDGSTRAGWYSFLGQSPKLRFDGDQVRITSGQHSTVLLSRAADTIGSAAEVSLTRAPISTSSISGLAVLSDAQHAMVIGLESGSVILWQLDPAGARVVARQQVNSASPLEFRVTGGSPADVRFFWRHQNDGAWHPLGDAQSNTILSRWREPLRFGLLLDGPQGSQVTFSNYRSARSDVAGNQPAPNTLTAMLVNGE